ncbi:helix-turn-helix transcriptional regulator [Roseobacteraceae bacterium S113]
MDGKVTIYPISQATRATFTELYFRLTFFFFIQSGAKYVHIPSQGEMLGEEGDLMIFPPGASVTMENRPVMEGNYRALGLCYTNAHIAQVFGEDAGVRHGPPDIQVLRAKTHRPADILALIEDTLADNTLPSAIREHRLLEPLLWLRAQGFHLTTGAQDDPISQVRRLIESDLARTWTAVDVANHLAMSEATMRRRLAGAGQGFAKILLHTRLEHGLSLLQTTPARISEIALECGFKTPSHFSDAFRKRFGIKPKDIRLAAD